ncbi:uncharacterized protein LOC102718885 isoform X1 [Oryza brachyantha]|uniref:uncharacterized protein LOC102718885 isoform X1 n=1 Tax=Oryza brachyantha TaxID=4533 RepID=UPI001ADCF0DD|nr:uncharacterized protein LOC102718885 isoform X1 [Oryza brachyantha]
MFELLNDEAHGLDTGDLGENNDSFVDPSEGENDLHESFCDASKELYPGSKNFSKLCFVVKLLNIKFLGGWSDKSFDMLLELLREAFPEGSTIPKNFNKAKKMIRCFGLGYVNIHACENDCILFRKQYENANICPKCNTSRWKTVKKSPDGKRLYKVPRKVLRYFPLKKRLQKLFMSPKSATDARWHDEARTTDGLLRHPADSPAWKHFDCKHPKFSEDSRNIRLALATDGFNPFRSMNCSYSIWPVILIPLNFPPWICMKQPNFILSLLIPGPYSPGKDMDVYFEPLVDDLLEIFEGGVITYDASRSENFQLRAAIIYTITDFPGLGYAAGCVTSGKLACPHCNSQTCSIRLRNGGKTCYMAHRRFLDANHKFRFYEASFDGNVELRSAPKPLTGEEILDQTKDLPINFGKDPNKKRPRTTDKGKGTKKEIIWKRKSIWFRLPYWKDLLVPHNFDAMHIEKNVCDNIINTLLGIDGKSKDNMNARLDLKLLNIRKDLHPIKVGDSFFLPPAPFTLSSEEKKLFCQVLKGVRFPDGHASDLRHHVHVNEKKIIGLKSHDNHILLQYLLPLAVRKVLPENVSATLIRVSNFFKKIYSPVIRISDMEKLDAEIAETLSLLETMFLPSFFDIMVHLMVHLPTQARLAGPVHYRNMYPVERFLMRLKGYVRTKSHPEGSIAESYVFDESLTFCSRYLEGCETRFSRKRRNGSTEPCTSTHTMPFFCKNMGRELSGKCIVTLDYKTWCQAHRYVLFNYDHIEPYLRKHLDYLSSLGHENNREISRIHFEKFHEWFGFHVAELLQNGEQVSEEIQTLANEPSIVAKKYNSYSKMVILSTLGLMMRVGLSNAVEWL